MPVTYSFSTTLVLPTSSEFTCMDVGGASMPVILSLPDISANRGAPWISFDANNDMVLLSDDSNVTRVSVDLSISQKFTFEVEFVPHELPADLDHLDNSRYFLATYDSQDNAGGVLISRVGIAIVSAFGNSASVVPGSFGIIPEGSDSYTIRMVVDGSLDTMDLYITRTDLLSTIGHQLAFTTVASLTPVSTPDHAVLEVVGNSTSNVKVGISTLKMNCSECLYPNKRPIADPGADQTAKLGSIVRHDGTGSYDPEGSVLTHKWSLIDAPYDSKFVINGVDGYTLSDGGGDGYTKIFKTSSDAFGEQRSPLLQPGDILLVGGVLYEVSTDRWSYNSVSNVYERDSGTWLDTEIVLTSDAVPDNLTQVAWVVFHSTPFFDDRTQSVTETIPDTPGVYIVSLTVNDGQLDSLPTTSLLNVNKTAVPLGCIPSVSWVWDHLSDFWELVDDKAKIETVWSGFAQAAAAQLLTAWQVDYNKSLLDIQRVFQRRWLSYSPLLETDLENTSIRLVRGPIYSSDVQAGLSIVGKTLHILLDGNLHIVTFQGAGALTPEDMASQINEGLGFSDTSYKVSSVVTATSGAKFVKLSHDYLLQLRPVGTANTDFGFSTSVYMQNDLRGDSGQMVTATNPNPPPATVSLENAFEVVSPTDETDFDFRDLGVSSGDILEFGGDGFKISRASLENVPSPSKYRSLSLLDSLTSSGAGSWSVPSVIYTPGVEYDEELVSPGDLVRFFLDTSGDPTVTVYCNVVAVVGPYVGFDPLPLLSAYGGDPDAFTTMVSGVLRLTYIPVDDVVDSIPRLQEIIQDATFHLTENDQYYVTDFNNKRVIKIADGTFSLLDPPPDTLWAEVTYLDNRPTVEDNFGSLVNFTIDNMENVSGNLDYLSAVRGLWWAYFGGPSLQRVHVGTQILLGLPFAEAEGEVTDIDESFSAIEGRIVIRDKKNDDVIRTYFYPRTAGLPVTDSGTLAIGSEVSQFDPLCGGIDVKDYISDPSWMDGYVSLGLMHGVDKYFRFLVRGDVDTFSVKNLVFAIDFVKRIKPHYTYPLFVLLKNLDHEEIDVVDTVSLKTFLRLSDSSCPNEYGAYRWDDSDGGGVIRNAYDETSPRFLYDKQSLCPSDSVIFYISYLHPGSAGWFYDTIWAYDDGDRDNDTVSDDVLPLSGPDSSPPAPYGPLIGVIQNDATVAAGKYWRSRS